MYPAKTKTAQYCDRLIILCLLFLVFIVPLFFGLNVNSLDIQKISALRSLSLIIFCLWVIKIIWSRELSLVRTPLDWPILAFVLIAILATIFSVNRWISLFGYYGHHEGLLVILNYIFVFYCLVNFIKTKRLLLWVINVSVASGLCASVYGIMQRFELDPVKWELEFGRVPSSLGNPIGFGNYAAMCLLLCVGIYFAYRQKKIAKNPFPSQSTPSKKKKKKKPSAQPHTQTPHQTQTPAWQIPAWIYGVILGLTYIGFTYSNSRAPFLGLAGGLFLIGLLVGKRIWLERKKTLAVVVGIFMVLTICFGLTMKNSIFQRFLEIFPAQSPSPQSEIAVDKEAEEVATGPVASLPGRVYIWQGALRIVAAHPILGTGIDTLGIMHPQYTSIESVMAEGAYATAASAHNELLDIASSRGLLGVGAYLWLLAAFVLMAWKVYKSGQSEDKYILAGLAAAILACLIQNQFSPTGISTSLPFWVILSLVCTQQFLFKPDIYTANLLKHRDPALQWTITLAGVSLAVLFFILFVVRPGIADFNYEQGTLLAASKGSTDGDTLYRFERAVKFNPYETQYRRDVCAAYIEMAKSLNPKWIKKAIDEAKGLLKINSYDSVGYSVLGAAYYLEGKELNKAVDAYAKAIEVDPYNPDPHNILALVYQKQGKMEKAAKEFRGALRIRPDYDIVWNNLVNLYSNMGKVNELEDVLKGVIAEDPGIRSIPLRHKLTQFYLQKAGFDEAKRQCKQVLKVDPNNQEGYKILGNIYFQQQQFKEAEIQFQRLLQISPTNTYAQQILQVLKTK